MTEIKLPPLVGTLAAMPPHHQKVIKAYGEACARAALQSQDLEDTFCVWHNDPETDNSWGTSCRHLFEIYDGTPTENSMTFCCYCGKPIRESIEAASRVEEK